MKLENLSPESQSYITRIHLYDGVVLFGSLLFTLSTYGIWGLILWVPFALYAVFVGYVCRNYAYEEDERLPYLAMWALSILAVLMLHGAGASLDNFLKK
jgi:hypothetical protein